MDDIDRQIVALLRQNARRSFQSIGMRVSLSAPAVKRRVDRLEADGVIRGYSAAVDPALDRGRTQRDALADVLERAPGVLTKQRNDLLVNPVHWGLVGVQTQ